MQGSHGAGSDRDADDAESAREGSPEVEGDEVQAAAYRRVLELERENERLEALLDVLGHDLRNHLAVAKGRLDLAREAGDDEDLAAVARAHERMEELLEDLLDSDAEGFAVGETEPVSLGTCARRAWAAVDPREAELVVESDPGVLADRARLVQLLENLFRNSLEHGRDDTGTHLTVTVGPRADGPGFYVADDGRGLPETRRGRLFEPGFSTSTGGTGLGLSIVRDVVVGHGWTVEAAESGDGGALFEFTGVERPARPPAERAAE